MSDPLVSVANVTKTFEHEGQSLEVLKGIDLEIGDGEMVTIVGPSGAGKSTLLHLIGTLDLPTRGTIRYQGQDVTLLGSSDLAEFRNRSIGFVFQFHHLLPEFTALENVMMPGLIHGSRRLEERARLLLDEVGLSHRLTHRPGELSGGEQQRVALARALLMEPKLVLADEPTGNLDSRSSDAVQELFFELNRRHGTTFLIVTHSRDFAGMMPRQVAMKDGRIDSDERRSLSTAKPTEQTPGNDAQPLENQGKPT
ncbi:MAG: ABC transporter ATP-binding protein [Myxococcales bacterium]|nr:ABC transporter ATP-binding protein [Myxococcales bacterium]MDH3484315.1 ABC transporter ATP-binding protein [Myxococcales bacterium]